MNRVRAEAMISEFVFNYPADITHVRHELGELAVTLMSSGEKKVVVAKFAEVSGFRLLDEGDLLEFWPACASANGWLFRIVENGWFDLEISRPGFMREKGLGLSEYFITSQNSCLSVLSVEAPSIEVFRI